MTEVRNDELVATLGRDLVELTARLPSPVVSARRITGLPIQGLSRATFKLRAADGTTYKGRRLDTPADALRVYRLARRLDPSGFPRPIARRGVAVLEPWTRGRPARNDKSLDLVRRCGALMGTVHSIPLEAADEAARWAPRRRLADVGQRLGQLRDSRLLSQRSAAHILEIARASVPQRARFGVVHRDLFPRNVVVDRSGGPWVIDNGNIGLGAHAFDLARTEYLWPMDAEQRKAFVDGYADTGPALEQPSPFWTIDVLSEVAVFRMVHGARGVSRPVGCLKQIGAA